MEISVLHLVPVVCRWKEGNKQKAGSNGTYKGHQEGHLRHKAVRRGAVMGYILTSTVTSDSKGLYKKTGVIRFAFKKDSPLWFWAENLY